MAEKREGEIEVIGRSIKAAKRGINKLAVVGFVGAAVLLGLCSAPFALAAWWWNAEPTQATPARVAQPLNVPQELCEAGQVVGWWDDSQGRHYFCTLKGQ